MTDLLITGGTIVTMEPDRGILDDGAVAIEGDEIRDVGPADRLETEYSLDRTIGARGSAVIPGLINCHAHVSDVLFRGGIGSDRELYDWLYNVKLPGVGAMTPDEHAIASGLFAHELLQAGTTTVVENAVDSGSGYGDDVIDAKVDVYGAAGIRNVYGQSFIDAEPDPEFVDYPLGVVIVAYARRLADRADRAVVDGDRPVFHDAPIVVHRHHDGFLDDRVDHCHTRRIPRPVLYTFRVVRLIVEKDTRRAREKIPAIRVTARHSYSTGRTAFGSGPPVPSRRDGRSRATDVDREVRVTVFLRTPRSSTTWAVGSRDQPRRLSRRACTPPKPSRSRCPRCRRP